ncbi:MAG: cation diffusion facilitator family transporter [Candidatus Cryptobacteroides sp.]
MGHNHTHSHSNAGKNISTAFFLNAFFVIVELVGGILTNSIAILTDSLHDFGDCLSLAIAWFLQKKSEQPRDKKYSYGYKRFSLLGSIFLSGVLTVSSILVLIEAGKRIASPQEVSAQGMLWMAVFGIIINGASALSVKRGSSMNERAVFLHIMEDVLGWVGVLIAGIVMMFAEVPVLDPLLSVCISIWVLVNVCRNLKSVFKVFLQATPSDVPLEELSSRIAEIEDVQSIHDLHIWSLDGESHIMTLHIVTDVPSTSEIKSQVLAIARDYHIVHTTIEFEPGGTVCTTNCDN